MEGSVGPFGPHENLRCRFFTSYTSNYFCWQIIFDTFIVDDFHGRSRAIRQDGDNVDVIQEAIDTCPVDCIHWVKFEDLDDLENSLDRDMFQSFGKPPRMNKH